MKKMIILFVLLITAVAQAGFGPDNTWEELRRFNRYDFDMPRYWVGGNTNIEATGVCKTADSIRTLATRTVCVDWQSIGTSEEPWVCVRHEEQFLSTPIAQVRKHCTEWDNDQNNCIGEWISENYNLPTEFVIDIFEARSSGDGDIVRDDFVAFTKDLIVPDCN